MSSINEQAPSDNICLAAPYDRDCNNMPGNERVRFLKTKTVHSISDINSHEVGFFLAESISKCRRMLRLADGRVLNEDCPASLRKVRNSIGWVATLVTSAATLLCFAATASLAQPTEKGHVKEFNADSGKDFVKEFASGNENQQPSGSPTVTGTEPEGVDDERKRLADLVYKKKLLNAKLPETFDIAVKFHHLGDLEKAIPFYKKVLTEDPKFESAYNNLALCLIERKAAGDLDEVTELLSQSQKLSTTDSGFSDKTVDEKTTELPSTKVVNNGGALFVQGQLSEQSGDLPKAIDYYLKALDQQQPLNLIIIKHLSGLYVKMGNYTSARAVLKRGILSAPPVEHMNVLYQAITNLDNKAKPNKVE